MQIDLTIKNYRCFADLSPARITIQPGFTGFLGANNSGKSTILKFFYEFRALFRLLSSSLSTFYFLLLEERRSRTNCMRGLAGEGFAAISKSVHEMTRSKPTESAK